MGGIPKLTVTADLVLRLKSSEGTYTDDGKTTSAVNDDDVIGAWEDQSGNGNDVTQSTAAYKPVLKLNIMNGQPVIRFDGGDCWLENMSVLLTEADANFEIFIVVQTTDNTLTRQALFGQFNADAGGHTNHYFYLDGDEVSFDEYIPSGGTLSTVGADLLNNTTYLVNIELDGTNRTIRINNVDEAGDSSIETFNGNSPDRFMIGSRRSTTSIIDELNGDIAEILVYDTSKTAGERSSIVDYLSSLYGFL